MKVGTLRIYAYTNTVDFEMILRKLRGLNCFRFVLNFHAILDLVVFT